MPRRKIISDADVLTQGLAAFRAEGPRGLSFGAMAAVTGLAPSTLAQRFGTQAGLQAAVVGLGWDRAQAALARADLAHPPNGQNAMALVKALTAGIEAEGLPMAQLLMSSLDAPALLTRASAWRRDVEAALEARIDLGAEARAESAAALFAAWQGRWLWQKAHGGEFRLRRVIHRRQK